VKTSETFRVEREAPTLCASFSVSPTIDNQTEKKNSASTDDNDSVREVYFCCRIKIAIDIKGNTAV